MYILENLLKDMVSNDASDLHLSVGSPPRIRKNGLLVPLDGDKLSPNLLNQILQDHLDKDRMKKINLGEEIDFSIGIPGISRFRVNVFKQRVCMRISQRNTRSCSVSKIQFNIQKLYLE